MAIRRTTSTSASPSPLRSSTRPEGTHSATPVDAEDIYNIEKSVLLDIAFLHSIATHRPIGPHKHFNVIPILLNLDRTARQVGARIRDDGYSRGASGGGGGGAGDDEGGEGSSSLTTRTIKREETADEDDPSNASIAFASLPIDSQMVWMRLEQLYDVGGLEELENLAIDNDIASPFRNGHSLYNRMTSVRPPLAVSASTRFGFGSGLEKKKKAPSKAGRPSHKKAAAAVAAAEDGDDDINDTMAHEQQAEFELGPWDEYESLIAPRRLKSYAPQEDGASESEEELSEPSELEAEAVNEDEEDQQQDDADDVLSEADEGDDNAEGEEEEEEEEEDGDTSTSKRKTSSKKQSAASKKAKKASSPTVKRGTRNSAKPRRSARR